MPDRKSRAVKAKAPRPETPKASRPEKPTSVRPDKPKAMRTAGGNKASPELLAEACRELGVPSRSNGRTFDWPRAATNGAVVIYDTKARRAVTSFKHDHDPLALMLDPLLEPA